MKIPEINRKTYSPINIRQQEKKVVNYSCENKILPTAFYYPCQINFGYANSTKLKTLFTYGLPDIYSDIERMIDPKKVQKMLKNNLFDGPIKDVIKRIEPFADNLNSIELKVYNNLLKESKKHPERTVKETIQSLVPEHKKQLRRKQAPILQKLIAKSRKLPEDYRYQFKQFMSQSLNKLDDKPIKLDYSRTEFKYNLEKIQVDVDKRKNLKASKVMKKLIEASEYLTTKDFEVSTEDKLKTLDFMEIILRSSVLKNDPQLNKLFETTRKRLNGEKILVQFSRKVFIYDLAKLLEGLPDEKLKNKMIELAEQLPTSRDMASAFIMKHRKNPSEKIIYHILWPTMASIEHLKPRACGGQDVMSNYAGACTRTNSDRSNISFVEQMKRIPHIKKYCQRYVDRLIELAQLGVFEKHNIDKKYIEEFKDTILTLSEGKINLDISKYYKLQ